MSKLKRAIIYAALKHVGIYANANVNSGVKRDPLFVYILLHLHTNMSSEQERFDDKEELQRKKKR